MKRGSGDSGEPSLSTLVGNVVRGSEALLGQQLSLLRAELGEEAYKAAVAGACAGAGAGCLAAGGALSTLMLVHWLHNRTRLPLWGCYGVVGGLLGAAGAGMLALARSQAAGLQLPPPQTTAALKENLAWLKEQLTPPARG